MERMLFHPDILPETADPQGSVRHENVNIVRLILPCREEIRATQFKKDENILIIYDCSPEYDNIATESFKGIVLGETDGTYSWWKSIVQEENK